MGMGGKMSNAIILEQINSFDGPMLMELSQLLVQVVDDGASIGFLAPLELDEAIQYWQDVLQPGVILIIAKMDGRIAGTVQLHLALKQNGQHRAEVVKLMVHPLYRRNGIAKKLMVNAENRARQEERSLIVLDTRLGDPSNDLYRAMGYIEAGRIPFYAKSSNGVLEDTVLYYKLV